jgi:hypothetical protein
MTVQIENKFRRYRTNEWLRQFGHGVELVLEFASPVAGLADGADGTAGWYPGRPAWLFL